MIKNRVRELRKSHCLSQDTLAGIIGTTQQAVSRMERCDYDVPSDLLVKMAGHFNVTTDYILGISETRRDLGGHVRMNREMDECYEIVQRYRNLDRVNRKTLRVVLERLEQAQREEQRTGSTGETEEEGENAEDSDM